MRLMTQRERKKNTHNPIEPEIQHDDFYPFSIVLLTSIYRATASVLWHKYMSKFKNIHTQSKPWNKQMEKTIIIMVREQTGHKLI